MHVIRTRRLDHFNDFHLDLALAATWATAMFRPHKLFWPTAARISSTPTGFPSPAAPVGAGSDRRISLRKDHGGVVASSGSSITESLAQLRGAGGRHSGQDKNWTVVRAVCRKRHGFDPQMDAQVAEAMSKSTLVQWLEAGQVEVAVLPWHLVPRMIASGRFRQLCDVLDLLPDLDVPSVPTTFFVVRPDFAATRRDLLSALSPLTPRL